MIYIRKQREPKELTQYRKTEGSSYDGLFGKDKLAVYDALLKEQYGLCAYCMCRIFYNNEWERNIQIEHFTPQSDTDLGTAKSLDYKNMLGVCDGGIEHNKRNEITGKENLSCDAYKGDKILSLNPSRKDDFEKMKIYYSSNGRIHSRNPKFDEELNSVLNLNTPRLITERKNVKQKVIQFISQRKKLSKTKKVEMIRNFKIPNGGLLMPFYDVAVHFMELLG